MRQVGTIGATWVGGYSSAPGRVENVRDAGERVRLLPIAANPDVTPSVFRITDGQVATFTTTFNY